MLKGVIFDLDGTLIDSMSVWENVGADFLISQGKNPEDNLNQKLKAMSFKQSSKYFIEKYNIKLSVKEIIFKINKMVENYYKNCIQLKPYAKDIIDYLNKKDIKICVATETDEKLTKYVLQRLGILKKIEFVLTCGEIGVGKYNPKIYLESANRLSLNINEIIVVEDSLCSIKTAKNAEFYTVAVFDGQAEADKNQIILVSDKYINTLEELKNIL